MARLTIPDEQTFAEFTVVTSTSAFPITFSLFAKADLTVIVDGTALTQSDFTFAGTLLDGGGYDGGTVTLNVAVDDVTVRIERNVAPARTSNFAPAASTPVGSVDQALNRLTAVQQDIDRRQGDSEVILEAFTDDVAQVAEDAATVAATLASLTAGTYTQAQLLLGGTTVTDSTPLISGTQTWNDGAEVFTGYKLNVTDTASAAASKLLDLQVGGASKASISKGGVGDLVGLTISTNATAGLAPLRVGTQGDTSSDAGIAISRNMFDAGVDNGHGFVEKSLFRRTGSLAFAAFDAFTSMQGESYDHWAGFQDRPIYQAGSGVQTMQEMYGLYSSPTIDTGTVVNRYAVYAAAPTLQNSGAITNQYGFYAEDLTTGGTNWAFYSAGATPSYFGGAVTLNGGVTGSIAQALSANTAGHSITGYSLTGSNAQSALSLTGTWNTSGNPSALSIAITNTASGANSRLIGASVGGSEVFTVDAQGIVRVGSYGASSVEPGVVISRNMFDSVTTAGHGFVERTYFRRPGTNAFAAFDAYTTMAGQSYDHWAGFQDRPSYQAASGGQTMINMYGYFTLPSIDTGTVTNRYGAYVAAPTLLSGGVITNQYAYYAESLTTGGTNWAFYAAGATPSYFGGAVTLNGGVTGSIAQALSANTAALTTTGYSLTGSNASAGISLTGTWNTSGAPAALNIAITNTASAATSRIIKATVGGSDVFTVSPLGAAYFASKVSIGTTGTNAQVNIEAAPSDTHGLLRLQSASTADNVGITLWARASGAAANARTWQVASNYGGVGNLDFLRSTTSTGNPTTRVASFDKDSNFDVDGTIRAKAYTVATLPTGTAGARAYVTDANTTLTAGIGTIVAGGGANGVPVYKDSANWRIG